MKKKLWVQALVVVCALGVPPRTVSADDAPAKPSIVANVSTFRNKNGMLGCRLYKSATGFPEQSAGTTERRIVIVGGSASCSFDDLEPGTYAVSVMHDENNNQRLDKNFLGIPTEGYGVSNNHTHAMSSPSWDESKFVVERGKKYALSIQLRY